MTEVPISDAKRLAAVARDAAASGQVVYLTDGGRRLAAIVPARLAELLDRGSGRQGRRALGARGAGRSGQHDISERVDEIFRNEVA
jgi:antitoxin (DNA-binding transcriptional repressor) of toxin-antitoxin stability system